MSQTKGLILAVLLGSFNFAVKAATLSFPEELIPITVNGKQVEHSLFSKKLDFDLPIGCLLYTSPSPRDRQKSRMPSSA